MGISCSQITIESSLKQTELERRPKGHNNTKKPAVEALLTTLVLLVNSKKERLRLL